MSSRDTLVELFLKILAINKALLLLCNYTPPSPIHRLDAIVNDDIRNMTRIPEETHFKRSGQTLNICSWLYAVTVLIGIID